MNPYNHFEESSQDRDDYLSNDMNTHCLIVFEFELKKIHLGCCLYYLTMQSPALT